MSSFYTQTSAPYVVISITKTQCFGQCPAFEFKLYSDCTASFIGTAFVEKMGEWETKATKDQYEWIMNEFEESKFFNFEDRYYAEFTDLPTTYLFYSNGEEEKKIMDYYGAPQELKDLEAKVESFIDQLEWKPTNKR